MEGRDKNSRLSKLLLLKYSYYKAPLLDIKSLREVLSVLNKYEFNTAKSYRRLGIELCLSPLKLDEIEANHSDVDRRLQGVLSAWLCQITEPPPTWTVLKDALKEIGEKYAAEGIDRGESQAYLCTNLAGGQHFHKTSKNEKHYNVDHMHLVLNFAKSS